MKIIGIGAAGNKAVVNAIKLGAAVKEDCLIMNSTIKDFPTDVEIDTALISSIGGCGKERELGKEIMCEYLSNTGAVAKLKEFVGENEDHVVIVTSMAGGTGSGSANTLGRFIHTELFKAEGIMIDITIIAFRGFNEDLRELQNSLNFCKDIDKDFTVQIIDNSSFMKLVDGNKIKAEEQANLSFAVRISFMSGRKIVDSSQNIDATDLYKLVTTPGYQQIEYAELKDIKNRDDFAKAIKDMIDNSNGLPSVASCSCFGIMLNINPDTLNYFDFSYEYLKSKYGNTTETYTHIQYCESENVRDKYEWIAIIVSGLDLPVKEMEEMYQKYLEMNSDINETKAKNVDFFSTVSNLETNAINTSMNRGNRRRRVTSSGTGMQAASSDFLKKEREEKKTPPLTNGKLVMNQPIQTGSESGLVSHPNNNF